DSGLIPRSDFGLRTGPFRGPTVRKPAGVLLPPISAPRIRRRDLYRALRVAVLEGALSPGSRLPSTRQAAADYGVSRGMVEEGFAQLTEEGFFERAVGRGTFVTLAVARLAPNAKGRPKPRSPEPSARGRSLASNAACREPPAPRPFNGGIADTS